MKSAFKNNYCLVYSLVLLLLFLFWIVSTLNFAFSTSIGSPPDEMYHIKLSKLYGNVSTFIAQDTKDTIDLGIVSKTPNLYHLILGKTLVFSDFAPIILRIENFLIGIFFIIFSIITIHSHTSSKKIRILFLFLLSNIVMLQYLFGAVSYDNFINLFALISFYYFHKIIQNNDAKSFKWLIIISLLGVLVKFTYIPLFLVQLSVICINYYMNGKLTILFKSLTNSKPLLLILLLLSSVILYFYGLNLLRYGALTPSCKQVVSSELCTQDPNTTIKNQIYLSEKINPNFSNIYAYGFSWLRLMFERTFGIFSHQTLLPNAEWISFLTLFSLFSLVIVFKQINNKYDYYLFFISVFYTLILFIKNYNGFLLTGINAAAVQGRYVFPILFPLIYLFSKYYIKLFRNNKLLEFIFILITIASVFSFGFLYFFNFEGMFSIFRII